MDYLRYFLKVTGKENTATHKAPRERGVKSEAAWKVTNLEPRESEFLQAWSLHRSGCWFPGSSQRGFCDGAALAWVVFIQDILKDRIPGRG